MVKKLLWTFLILIFIMNMSSYGEIKSQWRGPNRDGIYNETNLLKKFCQSECVEHHLDKNKCK